MNGNVIAIGHRTGGMYLADLRGTAENAIITPEVSGEMLRLWHSRLAHATKTAIKQTMALKAISGFDKVYLQPARSCSSCVEGTMPKTAMKLRVTLERQPSAVFPTNVAKISVTSIGGAH